MLNDADVWTAVVTNQRGVALGRMTSEDLEAVHARLREQLCEGGAVLDGIYACEHGAGECECRKPAPGLLLAAQQDHPAVDFGRAAIIGDSPSDLEAGRHLGLTTMLISDVQPHPLASGLADYVVSDLVEAARVIVGMRGAATSARIEEWAG